MCATTSQFQIAEKITYFAQSKLNPTEYNLHVPARKKLIGTSSILAQGKSCVLHTEPLFMCEIDYIPMYPSNR